MTKYVYIIYDYIYVHYISSIFNISIIVLIYFCLHADISRRVWAFWALCMLCLLEAQNEAARLQQLGRSWLRMARGLWDQSWPTAFRLVNSWIEPLWFSRILKRKFLDPGCKLLSQSLYPCPLFVPTIRDIWKANWPCLHPRWPRWGQIFTRKNAGPNMFISEVTGGDRCRTLQGLQGNMQNMLTLDIPWRILTSNSFIIRCFDRFAQGVSLKPCKRRPRVQLCPEPLTLSLPKRNEE